MKIALTGGGTAGHVNPNIALLPALKDEGFEVIYIGSFEGIERKLLKNYDIKYFPIPTGKLRRYFDLKNFTDMFRTISGVSEAAKILKREKVDIVFSKGGFVGVPVVLGARRRGIPVVVHESDYTPGLANKIAIPFAKKVCVTFPETISKIGKKKAVLTGNPIRSFLFEGNAKAGISFCGFKRDKPVLLIMGGSLGSRKINDCIRSIQKTLSDTYNVVHICGKGNVDEGLKGIDSYRQFEYIDKELNDVLAAADVVISRAGANAVAEFLALKKPNLLIPLSKKASRGDQILNAASFQKNGYSMVLDEEEMSEFTLLKSIDKLYDDRAEFIKNMEKSTQTDAAKSVIEVVKAAAD